MIGLGLIACVPALMWIAQTILLKAHGLPVRGRIDAHGAPRAVRLGGRIATQAAIVGVLVAYPLARGIGVRSHYAGLLPLDGGAIRMAAHGMSIAVLFLCVLYGAWLAADCVRFELRRTAARLARHLAALPAGALAGAAIEELLFRGVVQADLAGPGAISTPVAVMGGATAFAAAHYVRAAKRYWTIPGHLLLGALLGTAFARTGNLWLPIGLHAGGSLVIMGLRPFIRYTGPAWLTGASIYPYAGAAGLIGLSVLTTFVWLHY